MTPKVGSITPQGDPMTEIALRGSLRHRRRRTLTMAGAAVAVGAVVVALVAAPRLLDGSPHRGVPANPGPVVMRQPAPGEIAATIGLPAADSTDQFLATASVAYDHVFVHIQQKPSAIVVKVDPDTDTVVDSLTLPKDTGLRPGAVPTSAAGALWWPGAVPATGSVVSPAVFRLDPDNLKITATVPVRFGAGVASDGTRVWVISGVDQIAQIDTTTNRLTGSTAFTWPGPGRAWQLTYAARSLWVTAGTYLVQLSPDDLSVISRTALPEEPSSILAVGETVWVSLPKLDQLLRVTANGIDGPPVQLPPGNPAVGVDAAIVVKKVLGVMEYDPQLASSSDGATVWAMTKDNQLVAVDVASGQVVDHIQVHSDEPHSMVAMRGKTVWVPIAAHPELRRFDWQPPQR